MTTILVIDDEKKIRETILQILELYEYQTREADNGRNGLELAKQFLPDLIVCDVMMPEMDGYEFLEALRNQEETTMIPCILVTAMTDKRDIRQGMELGADDYLTKPFTADELIQAIESRLERHQKIVEKFDEELEEKNILIHEIRQQIKEHKKTLNTKEDLIGLKDSIIDKLLSNLSNTTNNINLAVKMLRKAETKDKQEVYLQILEEECDKEITLLNEMKELQKILTPKNIKILQQFGLLKA